MRSELNFDIPTSLTLVSMIGNLLDNKYLAAYRLPITQLVGDDLWDRAQADHNLRLRAFLPISGAQVHPRWLMSEAVVNSKGCRKSQKIGVENVKDARI